MVLSNVFNVIGIHLLILTNLTEAMVVFSANFDDIKGIARKFVSEKVADDVVNAIASLNSNINVNLSVENEKAGVDRYSGETTADGNTAAAQKHVPQNKHNPGEEHVNTGDFAYEDKTPGRVKLRNKSIRNGQIDKNEQQYHPTMETVNLDHRHFGYTSKKPNRVWSAEAPTRYTEKRKTHYNHREKSTHDDQRELEKSHVQDQRLDERTQNSRPDENTQYSEEKHRHSKANEANGRYENSPNDDANSKREILEPNTKIVNSEDTPYNAQISSNDETNYSKKSQKNWKNKDTSDEPVHNSEKRVRSQESTSTFNSAISLIGSILGAALKLNTENAQD